MARLAAKRKILFYPTREQEFLLIASNISQTMRGGTIIDPTCGTGDPLACIANKFGMTSYGNEIHPGRAKKAELLLDHCVCGAREFLSVEGTFSIVFDNPPYDDSMTGQRMEQEHIEKDMDLLAGNGLGIWVLPKSVMTEDMISFLQTRLNNVNVRRYPDPEYKRFNQVVVFGNKSHRYSYYAQALVQKLAQDIRNDAIPVLTAGEFSYTYDQLPRAVTRFETSYPESGEIITDMADHGVHTNQNWAALFGEDTAGSALNGFRPVLSMIKGHTAAVITAGMVDGTEVTIDGVPHLIKGTSGKKVTKSTRTDKEGNTSLISTETLVFSVSALNTENGSLQTYSSDDGGNEFGQFLIDHNQAMVRAIECDYPPLFDPKELPEWHKGFAMIHAPGILPGETQEKIPPAQQIVAAALAKLLKTENAGIIVGEMGCGKTLISQMVVGLLAVATLGKGKNWKLVVTAPPQVTHKWKREAEKVLREFGVKCHVIGIKRRQNAGEGKFYEMPTRPGRGLINNRLPGITGVNGKESVNWMYANGHVAKTSKPILDVIRAMEEPNPSILIMSYETAKNANRWEHAPAVSRKRYTYKTMVKERQNYYPFEVEVEQEFTKVGTVLSCPKCGGFVKDKDDLPMTSVSQLGRVKHHCVNRPNGGDRCGEPLWQQVPFVKGGREAVANFLNKHYNKKFYLIIDEAHKTKGGKTDVGQATMDLTSSAVKIIAMTGTIYNGVASGIFHIFYRLFDSFRRQYEHGDVNRFVQHHGLQETIEKEEGPGESYSSSYGYLRSNIRVKELPGIGPEIITRLLTNTVFIKLDDMGINLPEYVEERYPVPIDERLKPGIRRIANLRAEGATEAREGNPALQSAAVSAALGWLDCPVEDTLRSKVKGKITGEHKIEGILSAPDELLEEPLAKDAVLVEFIKSELAVKRGVSVYFEQVNRRDWMGRIQKMLEQEGIYSEILRQDTCNADQREAWYRGMVKRCKAKGQEPVMLANGNLVKEGLDLVETPTIAETGTQYNINDLRQRDRRAWRMIQTEPCRVVFFYYASDTELRLQEDGTEKSVITMESAQETGLQHIAAKLKAAGQADGNNAEGLATMAGTNELLDKLMTAVSEGEVARADWSGMEIAKLAAPPQPVEAEQVKAAAVAQAMASIFGTVEKDGEKQYSMF